MLWVMLCSLKFLFMVFVSASFASTILFINNSVTFDKLGAINGLAVSMTAITRYIGRGGWGGRGVRTIHNKKSMLYV